VAVSKITRGGRLGFATAGSSAVLESATSSVNFGHLDAHEHIVAAFGADKGERLDAITGPTHHNYVVLRCQNHTKTGALQWLVIHSPNSDRCYGTINYPG